MLCKERERLIAIYLAAVAQDNEFQIATSADETPANGLIDHEKALMAIYHHQVEHGC
jgi:hypothetical protein